MDIIPRSTRQVRYANRPALDGKHILRKAIVQHPPLRPGSTQHQLSEIVPFGKPPTSCPQPPLAQMDVTKQAKRTTLFLPAVHHPTTPRPVVAPPLVPKRTFHTNVVVVYGMAVVLFLAGLGITIQGVFVNHAVIQQTQALASSSVGDTSNDGAAVPSEAKPQGDYVRNYKVAAQLPRIIRIQKLGVTARILQVGVDENNQMQTPNNIYDTAWYTASSLPGEAGAMVFDGHYSGPTTNGVFSKLERLSSGDSMTVERGDGKVFTYIVKVVETKPVNKIDMDKLLVSVDTAKPGLNLITCGGTYNVSSNEFSDRTIVYTVLK